MYIKHICSCGSVMYINIRHDTTIQKTRPVVESEWISDTIHESDLVEKIALGLRETTDLKNVHEAIEKGFNVSPEYSKDLAKQVIAKLRTIQIAT